MTGKYRQVTWIADPSQLAICRWRTADDILAGVGVISNWGKGVWLFYADWQGQSWLKVVGLRNGRGWFGLRPLSRLAEGIFT